jgi:hypothetical protein
LNGDISTFDVTKGRIDEFLESGRFDLSVELGALSAVGGRAAHFKRSGWLTEPLKPIGRQACC